MREGVIIKLVSMVALLMVVGGIWQTTTPMTIEALGRQVGQEEHSASLEANRAALQVVDPDAQIILEQVFDGFTAQPTALTHAGDGSGRVYVAEQKGQIWFIENYQNEPKTLFLDIRNRVSCCSPQAGLFSLVFPPDFATKRHFYVFYTNIGSRPDEPDAPDHLVISRFHLLPGSDIADPDSEEKVIEIFLEPAGFEHKGGQLAFGPLDGYLYITVGDGSKRKKAQALDTLMGKVLRLDVESGDPLTYTVPASNPFTQTVGALPEIWSYGWRNPWRASFDPLTGDFFVGDVGAQTYEEISYQAGGTPGGLNFGWGCREGTNIYNENGVCADPIFDDPVTFPVTDPIVQFAHNGNPAAVIGGYMYRGSLYPALRGHYFYGDLVSGNIWSIYKTAGGSWSTPKLQTTINLRIHTFGEDENGEVYVLGDEYEIYRLVDINGSGPNLSSSTKTVSSPQADPNEVVTYTIKLLNTGGLANQTAFLTDTLPAGLSYEAASLQATHGSVDDSQSPILTWQGDLATTDTITISYQARVNASQGVFLNQAIVSGADANPPLLSVNLSVPRAGLGSTTPNDFFLPGTQPQQLTHTIPDPATCGACHTEPIYKKWRGSMMSQAGRDPLMWAALFIANQDAPNSGDFCLRCHTAKGWLEGRSHPADGSALQEADISGGVACEICHRLVDPLPSASDEAVSIDAAIRAALTTTLPSTYQGSAMMIIDPQDRRRGPFSLPVAPPHPISPTLRTDFFDQSSDNLTRSRLCGSCHNVDNPTLSWDPARQQFWPNGNDLAAPSFELGQLFPIERTFEEWRNSSYLNGVYAPQFAGAKADGIVGACQDCHMRRDIGLAAVFEQPVFRDCQTTGCLPVHEFVGGNTWVPQILQDPRWRLQSPDSTDLNNTTTNARLFLQKAATLSVTVETSGTVKVARVRVINETGHKLPTGYPEGRRMWLNLRAFDAANGLLYESGVYTAATAVLDTHNPSTKVYETKLGITPELAALLNRPDISAGESFHFVLNNTILKDNRIPPRGYTISAFDQPGLRPVGATYADGQYWDDTQYVLPLNTQRVEARLYYQTSSKEYIDFLRTNGGADGATLGTLWDDLKSPPELMAQAAFPPAVEAVSFTYLPLSPLENEPVTFSAQVWPANAAPPLTYSWHFGDGSAITATTSPTIAHPFATGGSYTVWLTATNINGSASVSRSLEVGAPVVSTAFNYQPAVPQPDGLILFSAVVSPAHATPPLTYSWLFGDGSAMTHTATSTISHSYAAAGPYTAVLTTANAYGQASFSQTLSVVAAVGETGFSHQPLAPLENDLVTFRAIVTPAEATLPLTYSWLFGDGSPLLTTAVSTVSHSYSSFGVYPVRLTAANAYGQASYSSTVLIAAPGQAVEATSFAFQPLEPLVSQAVTFTALVSPNYATPPLSYSWQFEAGATAVTTSSATVAHTYPATGTYSVMLTTSNPFGQAVYSRTVTILADAAFNPDRVIYLPVVIKGH